MQELHYSRYDFCGTYCGVKNTYKSKEFIIVITYLIIGAAFYVLACIVVAQTAHATGRSGLKWFFITLTINPLVAFTLLYFSDYESADKSAPSEITPLAAAVPSSAPNS